MNRYIAKKRIAWGWGNLRNSACCLLHLEIHHILHGPAWSVRSIQMSTLAKLHLNQFCQERSSKSGLYLMACHSSVFQPTAPLHVLLDYLHFFKILQSFFSQVLCTGCFLSLEHPFPHPHFI